MHQLSGISVLLFFASQLISHVSGAGTFQLKLRSIENRLGVDADGVCCSTGRRPVSRSGQCPPGSDGRPGSCRTRLRVCLMHYQTTVLDNGQCTYGEAVTSILGTDSFELVSLQPTAAAARQAAQPAAAAANGNFSNPLQLPFSFAWPLTFSLIIEAWHELPESKPTDTFRDRHRLIYRVTKQDYVDAGDSWKISESVGPRHAINFDYRVKCDQHYYGKSCNVFCKGSVNSTFGHYECLDDGTRRCLPGWTGDYCTKAVCLAGCHEQNGYCDQPNECKCMSGWQGQFCDECRRYPNCARGTCSDAWGCDCLDGWGGLFCNQDLNYCTNHRPCKNGATCHNSGAGSYQCTCPAGFSGTDCEVEEGGCAYQPCLNGGQCRDTGTNFTCVCRSGWSGHRCETAADTCADAPCQNGGSCQDIQLQLSPTAAAAGYQCRCADGFTGTNCEQRVSVCQEDTCGRHGKCVNVADGFRCNCEAGFDGDRCQLNVDDCATNPCLHGGTCVDGVNQFHCQCVNGFAGSVCHINVDDCVTSPCANGGHCYDGINDFTCTCRPGFIGKDCSINVDECVGQTCLNGGTCVDRVNGFECQCPSGFAGFMCEFEGAVPAWARSLTVGPGSGTTLQSSAAIGGLNNGPLPPRHVLLVSTLSVTVPALVLVSIAAILCTKYRRRRAAEKADEEARMQNERNACQGTSEYGGSSTSSGSYVTATKLGLENHMIVNTLDYPSGGIGNRIGGGKVKNIDDSSVTIYMERAQGRSVKQVNLDSCKSVLNTSTSSVTSSAASRSHEKIETSYGSSEWCNSHRQQSSASSALKLGPTLSSTPALSSRAGGSDCDTGNGCGNLLQHSRSPSKQSAAKAAVSSSGDHLCSSLTSSSHLPTVHTRSHAEACAISDPVFATEV